jgi:predicted ribosome quality control (RQC) complex YloA/Tae2 family protein
MPLDAVCLQAVKNELAERIIGMKIDKVQQPEKDKIIFSLRSLKDRGKLLICAGTGNARVQLTESVYENPSSPPMFCMLLRKYLTGGKITAISQPEAERILKFDIETVDQMGILSNMHLYVELIGSAANIILTDSSGIIVDCMRRISGEMETVRRVLPGLYYHLPEKQKKHFLSEISDEKLKVIIESCDIYKQADKWILETFCGISPLICREIADRAYGASDILMDDVFIRDRGSGLLAELRELKERINNNIFEPCILKEPTGKPKDFSFMSIYQYGNSMELEHYSSFSGMLDAYYSGRDKIESMKRKSQALVKSVKNIRDRTARRLVAQKEELACTTSRDTLRQYGDIIMANIFSMKKHMTALKAVDFYSDDGREISIPLDPLKTPQENAAKYYKEYTKAKNAEKHLLKLTTEGESELLYLNSVLESLAIAETERDIQEIKQELSDAGYIKTPKQSKKEKRIEQKPMHFVSTSGMDIWVGKNNVQNEKLTHKTAGKNDIWLHAQKIHGSHAVISTMGGDADPKTIEEAAIIAAYYSQGRESTKIPVDYTRIKYVKKSDGRPGMVFYTEYKTVIVSPDSKLVDKLKTE